MSITGRRVCAHVPGVDHTHTSSLKRTHTYLCSLTQAPNARPHAHHLPVSVTKKDVEALKCKLAKYTLSRAHAHPPLSVTKKTFNFALKRKLPFFFCSAADGTNVVKVRSLVQARPLGRGWVLCGQCAVGQRVRGRVLLCCGAS